MLPGQITPGHRAPSQRPTSVTVIAVLAIIFGGLGLVCSPVSAVPYFADVPALRPVIEVVKERPLLLAWTMLGSCLGLLFALALVIAGIGALMLKPWARLLLIVQAAVSIFFGVINTAVMLITFGPLLREVEGPAVAIVLSSDACGFFLGLVLNVLVLFFMTRPNVKAAFGAD